MSHLDDALSEKNFIKVFASKAGFARILADAFRSHSVAQGNQEPTMILVVIRLMNVVSDFIVRVKKVANIDGLCLFS